MSRELYAVEKGFRIYKENSDTLFIDVLFDAGAPLGTSGETDEASVGSIYTNTSNGDLYTKITDSSQASDWQLNGSGSASVGTFRPELIRAVTNDALGNGNTDPTSWTDNESGIDNTNFVVGDFVIDDADGTPVLREVTAISAPNITLSTPVSAPALATNDTFVNRYYLPDSPAAQEGQAIILKTSGALIKLGDVNWEFATGINLSSGYAAANGAITSADTVESAIEKLDGNQLDLIALSGMPVGSIDLGTFTGTLIPDNSDIKEALQALETQVEANIDATAGPADIAQSTPTTVDTVLVDECQGVEWEVTAHDQGDPTNVKILKIEAFHNGHAGADASLVKDKVFAKMKLGSNFNLQASAVLSGAGASQTIGLELETNDADGIRYTVRRTCIPAL